MVNNDFTCPADGIVIEPRLSDRKSTPFVPVHLLIGVYDMEILVLFTAI